MALVCHMMKLKRNDCGGIQAEDNRDNVEINSKNPDLDLEKTGLNKHYYYVTDSNTGEAKFFFKRQSRLVALVKEAVEEYNQTHPKRLRKDAVVCCSFILGADHEFFEGKSIEDRNAYFKCCMEFFRNHPEYGKVLECSVHHDEATPHAHLRVLPLTVDGRISAKEIYSRSALQQLQRQLPEWLNAHGFPVEAGKEKSTAKHLSELDFKFQKRSEALQKAHTAILNLKTERDTLKALNEHLRGEIERLGGDVQELMLKEGFIKVNQEQFQTFRQKYSTTVRKSIKAQLAEKKEELARQQKDRQLDSNRQVRKKDAPSL